MRDEGMNFARRLSEAGIPVTRHVLPGADNWPNALYEPGNSGCAACEATVQQHFREFFSASPPPH